MSEPAPASEGSSPRRIGAGPGSEPAAGDPDHRADRPAQAGCRRRGSCPGSGTSPGEREDRSCFAGIGWTANADGALVDVRAGTAARTRGHGGHPEDTGARTDQTGVDHRLPDHCVVGDDLAGVGQGGIRIEANGLHAQSRRGRAGHAGRTSPTAASCSGVVAGPFGTHAHRRRLVHGPDLAAIVHADLPGRRCAASEMPWKVGGVPLSDERSARRRGRAASCS